jgi:hypothetical protein
MPEESEQLPKDARIAMLHKHRPRDWSKLGPGSALRIRGEALKLPTAASHFDFLNTMAADRDLPSRTRPKR